MYDFIVTGASGYLGKSVVPFLENQGYSVLSLDKVLGQDLSSEKKVKEILAISPASNLINLFGINDNVSKNRASSSFLEVELETFANTLRINVVSLFSVCREFIRSNTQGSIINISSIYSVGSPVPHLYPEGEKDIAYGVSKAAVNQLTRHLAFHAAPNFRVNSIVLGGVYQEQPNDFVAGYAKLTALGRMAVPEDLNGIIEFLSSSGASYITGATIPVDGGWTAK